jgi:hypothetical protein
MPVHLWCCLFRLYNLMSLHGVHDHLALWHLVVWRGRQRAFVLDVSQLHLISNWLISNFQSLEKLCCARAVCGVGEISVCKWVCGGEGCAYGFVGEILVCKWVCGGESCVYGFVGESARISIRDSERWFHVWCCSPNKPQWYPISDAPSIISVWPRHRVCCGFLFG